MVFRPCKIMWRWPTAALLLTLGPSVFAASGFVTGASVTREGDVAEISVRFACRIEYVDHLPVNRGDKLRVQIESTGICVGSSPMIANSRAQYRPLNADVANLLEIDYDGESSSGQVVTLVFGDAVRYDVSHDRIRNHLNVTVHLDGGPAKPAAETSGRSSTRVRDVAESQPRYVINLSSSRTPHTASDMSIENIAPGLRVFETEVLLAGVTWHRLRLGVFDDASKARLALQQLEAIYPTAWIDRMLESDTDSSATETIVPSEPAYEPNPAFASVGLDKVDALMADARRAMVADEISRAVQIYTKVLRIPNHDRHAEAQEYLALAREKNGQTAHAKAEYQRYLQLYPDGDGASRVQQRLAALLASGRKSAQTGDPAIVSVGDQQERKSSDWRIQTFVSQYYRRDANQMNEEDEVISQSAVYSDINLDIRRRGSRFDFSSRLSAGYRNDFLDEDEGSGNELRVSYAYADLADTRTGLRGRIGRQSRNTGGVLGRFDGLNLEYRATERILVSTVAGQPVNSATDGLDSEKEFYGVNANIGPLIDNLELGVFYVQQDIEDVEDRQAVGTEFRYFGDKQSLWGLIDYDTSYNELSSAYLQGNWKFGPHLTLSGSIDRRHTPYLSTGSALIGQPVTSFAELLILMTEEEIRALSIDRSPLSNSYTVGLSYSLTPKLQFNADANQTDVDASPESGGVGAVPAASYQYFSTNFVVSSLFREGDVTMIGLRLSDSDTTRVISLNLDSRFPIGKRWRINPRLRVDQRRIMVDDSDEWIYTPGLRIQYRHNRNFRVDFEAGKQFAQRALAEFDLDRESYYVNIGYQAFF